MKERVFRFVAVLIAVLFGYLALGIGAQPASAVCAPGCSDLDRRILGQLIPLGPPVCCG